MKARTTITILLVSVVAWSASVYGGERDRPYSRTSLFFLYNAWSEETLGDDQDLNQAVAGLSIQQIVSPQFELGITGTYASTKLSGTSDSDVDFSSVNDTRVRGTVFFGQSRTVRASLKLNLPTGKKELTPEEYALTVGLADNARPYYVRRFGQGLDVGGEILVQPTADVVQFTLGGGFLYKGSYQILADDTEEYKYGDEISGIAGIAVNSKPVSASVTGTYKLYTDDEFGGTAVFKSGPAMIVDGRLSYTEAFHAAMRVTAISRGNAEFPTGEDGTLTEESVKSGRDELRIASNAVIPLQSQLRLLGRFDVLNVSENEYDTTSALYRPKVNHIGVGAGLGYQLTLGLWGSVVGTYYTGTVDDDFDLTGLGVTASLIIRYW